MPTITYHSQIIGKMKIITIKWKVPDFRRLLDSKSTRELWSDKSEVTSLDRPDPRIQLKMQFLGRNKDIIEIYYLSPNPILESTLTICQHGCENRRINEIYQYHTVQATKWQHLGTLFKSSMVAYLDLLSDGSLKLKFQFKVLNDIRILIDRSHISEAQLSSDFENLLNNGMFSDITIKSADMVEYKVHKAVLASRSTVLKAHFEHNTTECHTNIVESPLESDVLREVLTFIYSDKAPRVDEIPENLLAAADYYQLSGLKSLCEEALHKKLSVENAIDTLQLADLHSAKNLKQLTLEFIKDGQAILITKTEGWAKVKSVEVIKIIYEFIMADDIDADVK